MNNNEKLFNLIGRCFLNTFSEEQLILHQQKDVPRMERRKALKLSFSLEQKEMLKAHRAKLKKMKEAFRATLSEDQKKSVDQTKKKSWECEKMLRKEFYVFR